MDQNKRTDDKRPQQTSGGQYDSDQQDRSNYGSVKGQTGQTGQTDYKGQTGQTGQTDYKARKPFDEADKNDPDVPGTDGQ